MADVPLSIEPTSEADPALAERVRRLEDQLVARELAPQADEEVAQRVLTILAEKASQHRVLAGTAPPVPGLITTALTAARAAQAFFPAAPPGVAPQPTETGFRAWLLTQVVGEFRLMALMYFDARYRLSRVAQFGVPAVLVLMVMNYFFFAGIPVPFIGIFERVVLIVFAVVLYRLLAREAVRYKQVLDYLSQYGHG